MKNQDYSEILSEIKLINQSLRFIERDASLLEGWMPKRAVMLFDYGDTQLRALEIVCLIQRYEDLIFEKVERKLEDWKKTKKEIDLEKVEKERLSIEDIARNELPRGLWVSRTFTSLNR
jgi:hypothetical protein